MAPISAKQGFTLLELLLVIAIIAILAGLIIFNLNPAQRLQDTNDAKVRSDVEAVANAASLYIIDNAGDAGSLGLSSASLTFGQTSLRDYLEPDYIQEVPGSPSNLADYEIEENANSTVTVCGTINDTANSPFCVTR